MRGSCGWCERFGEFACSPCESFEKLQASHFLERARSLSLNGVGTDTHFGIDLAG